MIDNNYLPTNTSRGKTCQCWKKVKCTPSKKCEKKGGECVYLAPNQAISVGVAISGKNLCKKPCTCVKLDANEDPNV